MFIHNFSPVLIDLGYFEIRWYSIAYIFGIIFCWLYSRKIVKKFQTNHPFFSIKEKDFDDLVGYLIIGIIVGGRIGYVLFYNFDYYLTHLLEILMIWKGGMSFHGGLIGVVITTIFFCKTRNKHCCSNKKYQTKPFPNLMSRVIRYNSSLEIKRSVTKAYNMV